MAGRLLTPATTRAHAIASIRPARFAPREAAFSVPRLLRRRNSPRDLANTSKQGCFWFQNRAYANSGLAEEYDAAQGRGEVRTRADNQHFADGKKLSADEIGLVGDALALREWNPEDDAYATHALPGNPVVLAPPPSMAALPLGGAGVRDLPRPRGHPRGARLMTDPVQGRHSLECTSPKGRPFRGRCVLCGAEDLR